MTLAATLLLGGRRRASPTCDVARRLEPSTLRVVPTTRLPTERDAGCRNIDEAGAAEQYAVVVEGRQLKVVAVNRSTDTVVATGEMLEELIEFLRRDHLENTMVVRVPHANEPPRVGLG